MYNQISSPLPIYQYLKTHRYKTLPSAVWGLRPWLSAEVADLMMDRLQGKEETSRSIWIERIAGDTVGVAYVEESEGQTVVLIDAVRNDGLVEFLNRLRTREKRMSITVGSRSAIECISGEYETPYENGRARFYATAAQSEKAAQMDVRELTKSDSESMNAFCDEPYELEKYLSQGIRFFGAFADGKLVSRCGIFPLSAIRSEIIAVSTRPARYFRSGYAKATCSLAIREALEDVDVVTWSTSVPNTASCRTAISLGFIQYHEDYTTTLESD